MELYLKESTKFNQLFDLGFHLNDGGRVVEAYHEELGVSIILYRDSKDPKVRLIPSDIPDELLSLMKSKGLVTKSR